MLSRKFLVQQVIDLIIINLEVAAFDNENSLLDALTLLNLCEELLEAMDQDALISHLLNDWGCATISSCSLVDL